MKKLLIGVAGLAFLAACQPSSDVSKAPKAVEAHEIEALSISDAEVAVADGAYALSWAFAGEQGPVSIEVAGSPDAEHGVEIASGVTDFNFSWTPDNFDERRYFIIRPEHGEPELVASRLLPLEGGRNFRTLGGYETTDGKTVKWDKLYRSGVMTGLTEHDYGYLSGLGIKVICDFRTSQERTSEPTNWAAGEVEYLSFADPAADPASGFSAVFRDPELTPEKVRKAFGDAYFGIAHDQAPAYTVMFDKLAAGEAPLAFNCSAGKDRTGIAAALILTVLGVPRETIVMDYSLSDDYVDYMAEFLSDEAREKAAKSGASYAFFFQLPKEIVEPIMATYPEYIETFFADIEAEYGSVEAFLKEKVSVTDEEMDAIRALYLED